MLLCSQYHNSGISLKPEGGREAKESRGGVGGEGGKIKVQREDKRVAVGE